MEVLDAIRNRRSIRSYSDKKIDRQDIRKILEAGIWAPSGKNGQPWRFRIIEDKELIDTVSGFSIYKDWLRKASCQIIVFLDKNRSYNYVKDVQSCGAVIQNMLLCAHSLNIGSCWIGEVLPNADKIKKACGVKEPQYELMAVIAFGYYENEPPRGERRELEYYILD